MCNKKTVRSILSVLLASVLLLCSVFPTGAVADSVQQGASRAVRKFDKALDRFADRFLDVVIRSLMSADTFGCVLRSNRFPTEEEYLAGEKPYFYEGTDGKAVGSGWKLGYASASVIPVQWRRNANGEADPNGMRLNKKYYFGGYFGSKAHVIYDDERVTLTVLSAGNDANKNGIEDILIFASIDNIGIANGNVRDIRAAVSDALVKKGLAAEDIVAFEVTATHAHTVIEALGMSLDRVFFVAMKNHFLFTRDRAIEPELLACICGQTAAAAAEAYDKMESGSLYYFETPDVNAYMYEHACNELDKDTLRDKLDYGAANQTFWACWYFEGESGEKTILANTGLHPTFPDRDSDRVCADIPHYMGKIMAEAGYNFQFIQGSQAAIGLNDKSYTEAGKAWAEKNTLSYEEWVSRYGRKYADKYYGGKKGESEYFALRAAAYTMAHFILDHIDRTNAVEPSYTVRMSEMCMPLDYGIIYLAAVSGTFGYNTVSGVNSETGYGIMSEIGFVQLGKNAAMLVLPGEVSPTLMYGAKENYTGTGSWQGAGSFSGEAWAYQPIASYAEAALGKDIRILAMGITNDEVGYIMPDTDTAENFLTKTLLDIVENPESRAANEELMSASHYAGSTLVESYIDFFASYLH